MKRAYKCDYCNFVGTRKEVKEHEDFCYKNPTARPRMRDLVRCSKCDNWEICSIYNKNVYENFCFVGKRSEQWNSYIDAVIAKNLQGRQKK